jgi:ElaB/YqjD/DUF883 family membrane-anchored ribosome-binding protein
MSQSTEHTRPDAGPLKQKAGAAKDAVVDLAGEAKLYATDSAYYAKDSALTKYDDFKGQTIDYIRENPYKAIGIAAGVGLLVGLILKRR